MEVFTFCEQLQEERLTYETIGRGTVDKLPLHKNGSSQLIHTV